MYIIYVCVIYVIYIKQRKPSQQESRKGVYGCAQEGLREKMELKIKFKFKSSYELFGKKKWSQTWSHGTSVPFGYKFPSSCLTYFKQKCSGSNLSTLAQTTSLLSSLQYWTHSLFFSLTLLLRTNTLVSRPALLWADVFCIWNCDYRVLMNRSLALCVSYLSSAFAYIGIFLLFKVAGRFVTFYNSCRNVTFCNSQSHEKPREKKV